MRLKITSGVNTWLIAGESQAQADGNYQGRLLNELKLSQSLTALGSAPVTLNISVRNDDGYISPALDLWGAAVEITTDAGTTWAGTITAYDSDGDGITYLVATEKAAPELTIQMPDEVARLVTVDENFHSSAVNVTLPLVFGGNSTKPHLIKGILIDKTAGIYLLCVGEIHQVVKVYRGTEEITTGFSAYTGTAGQANYAGFAYLQLTDETIRKNDDGSYVEISADVIGLKLGSATIEQCRNGARVLYYLLTTAKDGVGGWGLGIGTSEINTTAFSQAISDVDAAGLKFDGIFYFRQAAQSWIDQICLAIRGAYSIGRDGKRALYINKSAASAKTYTETNMRMLRHGVGAYTGRVYNKGKLDFDYNPITGQFMQSAQYEDTVSVAAIGEQEFYGQSYLIKDMATAQAIVEYTCKKSLIGARKVYFETDELPTGARSGTVITVTRADLGISGDYQITSLEIGDHIHTIEAEKFDASIFSVGTPGTAIDWTKDPPIVSTANPGVASGLTLSSEVRPSPDGTNIVVLTGTFTPPAGKYLAASIEWGEGALPILSWNSLGMVQGTSFEIAPVKPAQAYAVRVRMTTSTGHSDYVTATITTEGDEVPPGAPSIGVTSYLKTVTIQISLASVPSDMAGFAIFRHTANNSAAASQIGSITSKDGRATYTDEAPAYGATYYYWVKSFDTWGNLSSFSASDGHSTLITAISGTDIVDGALSRSALFQAGVVDAAAIATAAVTAAKTAIAAIDASTGNIAASAVGELQLANDAVTAAKLAVAGIDGVTGAIAAGAVAELQLANDAVTAAKLNVAAIDGVSGAIVANAVGELQIAADAVTATKINVPGLDGSTGAIAAGAVAELQLASAAVTEAKIATAAVNTAQINNAALKAPLGAVLSLSAKNCTAASIAEVYGVRDVSGNMNHGQAFGGVTVSDSTIGKVFQFDNVSKYIDIPPLGSDQPWTVSVWVARSAFANATWKTIIAVASGNIHHLELDVNYAVILWDGSYKSFGYVVPNDGQFHSLTVIYHNATSASLYADGVFVRTITINLNLNTYKFGKIGNWSGGNYHAGPIGNLKIYNRALTAAEVKSLYMFPEDAAFGNITADLLSTGELITLTAQIKDAIITSAKINDLSADKINAGTLAADRIAAGSLAANKIYGTALVVSGAAADVNAGTTTVNGGKITALSITADQLASNAVTADKILAGSVTADKVTSGELITLTAQIKDATITAAKTKDLSADKITAGTLAAARIATGSLAADKITGGALVVGSAAGDVNAGATTINGGKITASSVTASQLASDSVTTDKLAAGSVTAAKVTSGELITLTAQIKDAIVTDAKIANLSATKITTGFLAAERIAAGSITGAKIASETITASNLLVANVGAALNSDPSTTDVNSWRASTAIDAISNELSGKISIVEISDGECGSSALKVEYGAFRVLSKSIPVDASKQYRFTYLVKGVGAVGYAWLTVFEITAAGDVTLRDINNIATPSVWTRRAVVFSPSAGVVKIQIAAIPSWGSTSGYSYVQDIRLEEVLPATLIQDGAITTDKINVSGLNASVIKAGTLDAARIAAGSLSADKITGGALVIGSAASDIANGALSPAKISGTAVVAGGAATDVNNGTTTISGGKITADSINVSQINSAALRLPAGALVAWAAKGASATSIVLAGGVKDVSGRANHGQAYGNTAVVDTTIGKAFEFDGAGDYIIGPEVGSQSILSFSFWAKSTLASYAWNGIMGVYKRAASPWQGVDVTITGAAQITVYFGKSDGGILSEAFVVPDLTADLRHIVVVADSVARTLSLYANGSLVATRTPADMVMAPATGRLTVGRGSYDYNNEYFKGVVAHPKLFNRALTAAEIKTLYMLGVDTESGTITADRITSDQIVGKDIRTAADAGNGTVSGLKMTSAGLEGWVTSSRQFFLGNNGWGNIYGFNIAASTIWDADVNYTVSGNAVRSQILMNVPHEIDSSGEVAPLIQVRREYAGNKHTCEMRGYFRTTGLDGSNDSECTIGGLGQDGSGGYTTAHQIITLESANYTAFYTNACIYIGNNCSARSFTDRTEMPESMEEALEIINTMQPIKGKVDYKRLSNKAKKFTIKKNDDGTEEVEEGRDLTKTVSALVMICQKLQEEVIRLQMRLDKREEKE